jgi:hypothetical protein
MAAPLSVRCSVVVMLAQPLAKNAAIATIAILDFTGTTSAALPP